MADFAPKKGTYHHPDFECTTEPYKMHIASFETLRKLRELEGGNLLKYGRGLSLKALYPTTLEKQNVKLPLQIFNDMTAVALRELGEKHNLPNFEGTAKFIDIITHWWSIVNVKTPFKGKRFKDSRKEPLNFTDEDENVKFLRNFLDWLDNWEKCPMDNGKLSKETHFALAHSTYALLELGSHCISSLGKKYFLPGSVQSDPLEARFGKYRQLAGSQYHISIRQLYEAETKLRMQNSINLSFNSQTDGNVPVDDFDIEFENNSYIDNISHLIDNLLPQVYVHTDDIENCNSVLPVILYLAGYCVFSTLKTLNCDTCSENLTMNDKQLLLDSSHHLIKKLDRGGLTYPHPDVTNAVLYNYVIIQKLVSHPLEEVFLKCSNQRELVCQLTMLSLSECEFDFTPCPSQHTLQKVFKNIVKKSTNGSVEKLLQFKK